MSEVCLLLSLQLPDVAHHGQYADSQLLVWIITSISELAIASYSEDVYGIVQRVKLTQVHQFCVPYMLCCFKLLFFNLLFF